MPRLRGFIKPAELEAMAQAFLAKHHPGMSLPVPIDVIAEHDLGLSITPLPGLSTTWGIEAYLSFGGQEIVVDEGLLSKSNERRYRFTIGEEVAHFMLHLDLVPKDITTLEQYLAFRERLDGRDESRYDWQAKNLAGRILVPEAPLVAIASEELARVQKRFPTLIGKDTSTICRAIAMGAAKPFNVSDDTVRIRLVGDGVCQRLGLIRPDGGGSFTGNFRRPGA